MTMNERADQTERPAGTTQRSAACVTCGWRCGPDNSATPNEEEAHTVLEVRLVEWEPGLCFAMSSGCCTISHFFPHMPADNSLQDPCQKNDKIIVKDQERQGIRGDKSLQNMRLSENTVKQASG